MVIKSFRDRETERIFQGEFARRIPKDIQRIAARKLAIIEAVTQLDTLRVPPSNRLEKLKGERADNTASESTTNGAFASRGAQATRTTLRLRITTRG